MSDSPDKKPIAKRFRGFLPVVVDVETGGFNAETDALLEIAAVIIEMRSDGTLRRGPTVAEHVLPFPGANMDPSALAFNKIDPYHPFRHARSEQDALEIVFKAVRRAIKDSGCTRAILVGHNPFFDHGFLKQAVARSGVKRDPFHPFSTFDTATLGALAYGQTVLSRIAAAAGMEWDEASAHSAIYDAEVTADLFCTILNKWQHAGLYRPGEAPG